MASVEVSGGSVDAMRRVLSYLVTERQRLRAHDAPRAELEANRKAIVAMQMLLARALGRRYGSTQPEIRVPPDQEEEAASGLSARTTIVAIPERGDV